MRAIWRHVSFEYTLIRTSRWNNISSISEVAQSHPPGVVPGSGKDTVDTRSGKETGQAHSTTMTSGLPPSTPKNCSYQDYPS